MKFIKFLTIHIKVQFILNLICHLNLSNQVPSCKINIVKVIGNSPRIFRSYYVNDVLYFTIVLITIFFS